ncbi:Pre-mRNA-splicing factor prp46 (macronuclear) [Tetrahymena thermophila SB210]|uniref:Pre-mRNA-splicing factor prp46 n=1 Tax=Tetrahymena thermophila (strain SB210) TaxID=312017 RepID=I7M448_TETTS|nr:Pre-mRNA-splicing factor prp46 [Tetrahymena thermophila SB210]EAS04901.1 Pre-mRNA-splicing factor prp46 [Tetrahymena thermophila SB210]|eukprot:XP_001025146.1 Pre-mRNA-splicing factor prp46 [Tetrahymena thermophila SB210]
MAGIDQLINQEISDFTLDSVYNSKKMFMSNLGLKVPDFIESTRLKLQVKINDEYKFAYDKQIKEAQKQEEQDILKLAEQFYDQSTESNVLLNEQVQKMQEEKKIKELNAQKRSNIEVVIEQIPEKQIEINKKLSKLPASFLKYGQKAGLDSQTLEKKKEEERLMLTYSGSASTANNQLLSQSERDASKYQIANLSTDNYVKGGEVIDTVRMGSAIARNITKVIKPEWHKPWKLMRVIAGHRGWVRCVTIDPANQFFVTGSNDRTIKFWDLASGQLKLTLTGHTSPVRALVVSDRHPYLFSAAEDKTVRCWDLEMNQVIRNYHGHLSSVHSICIHPTLNLIATGGRDCTIRLWDIRARSQVHVLTGHQHAVGTVISQEFEPQIVSGSYDNYIKTWDIAAGKCMKTLTNHKKPVKSLVFHHKEYTFASGAADNIKVWKCPEGEFLRNISSGNDHIVNSIALNQDNVLVSGCDDGTLKFWDWKSGYNFQTIKQKPQPGSIAAENAIFDMKFDRSQMRLITAECDKTIKVYKEDDEATMESHPINDFKVEYGKQVY